MKRDRCQGFSLLAVIGLVIIMAALGLSAFFQAHSYQSNILQRQAEMESLYLAQSVAERIIEEARLGSNWSLAHTGSAAPTFVLPDKYRDADGKPVVLEDVDAGLYSVSLWAQAVPDHSDARWVMLYMSVWASSRTRMFNGHAVERVVDMTVKAQSPARFFMTTSTQFSIGDGATINGDIMAPIIKVGAGTNAPIDVNGGVFYSKHITIGQHTQSTTYASPGGYHIGNVSVDGPISRQANVTFVSIDLSDPNNRYAVLARTGGYYSAGLINVPSVIDRDTSLDGAGTVAGNGIVYSEKDIWIGTCTYDEPMTFVAEGDIHIRGDLVSKDSAQIGLFAQGSIIIDQTSETKDLSLENIFAMANGMIRTDGAQGSGAFNSIRLTGSLAIKGQGVPEGTSAANLSSYTSRVYNQTENPYYNQPPGMPYMADLVEWSLRGDPAASP